MGNQICNLKDICGGTNPEKQNTPALINNNNQNIYLEQSLIINNNSHSNNNHPQQQEIYNIIHNFQESNNNIIANTNYIESYNPYNNFYFLINRITFLQKRIKLFIHNKKRNNSNNVSYKSSSMSMNNSITHKNQLLFQSSKNKKNLINKHNPDISIEIMKNIKLTEDNNHNNNNNNVNNINYNNTFNTNKLNQIHTKDNRYGTTLVNHHRYSNNSSFRKNTDLSYYSNSISLRSDDLLNQKEIKGYFLKKQKKYQFKGRVVGKKKQGFGKVTWEDRSYLYAYFENSKTQGFCKFYDSQSNSMFTGIYINNRPNGYGIFYKSKQVTYEGSWVNNHLIGIGTEIWKDETYYQGDFENSIKKGLGLYRWTDGTIYQGQWENNQMNGIGMLIYSDERMYQGEFKNGIMEGFGEFVWNERKKYFGYYKDNKKHGFGIFISEIEPLMAYIGFWEDGKLNGVGIKASGDSVKYGLWKEGKKELTLPGSWSVNKYFNPNHSKYLKFFTLPEKDIIDFLHKYGM